MRRRISLFMAATLVGVLLALLGPAQPASAWVVCAGTGNMVVSPGLLFPPKVAVGAAPWWGPHLVDIRAENGLYNSFGINYDLGGCTHRGTMNGWINGGALTGWCGHFAGYGTLGGQPFTVISVGTLLLFTGQTVGVANAVPVPVTTPSCLHVEGPLAVTEVNPFRLSNGGATTFAMTTGTLGLNCGASSTTQLSPRVLDSEHSIAPLGVPLAGARVHVGLYLWVTQPCLGPVLL